MEYAFAMALGFMAVVALGVATWGAVQCLRMAGSLTKTTANYMADVANHRTMMEREVAAKIRFDNARIAKALEQAGQKAAASAIPQIPLEDAPPPSPQAQNFVPPAQELAEKAQKLFSRRDRVARSAGRLDEVHEMERELRRPKSEEIDYDARDAVSFQGIET